MAEEGLKQPGARRAKAVLAALTIGVTAVAWAGCGDDEDGAVGGEAQERIEKGIDEGKQGVEGGVEEAEEGLEKGKDEVSKGIDKAQEEAEEGIEEAEKQADKYLP